MPQEKDDTGGGAHLRLRAQLMDAVCEVIRRQGLRQREAAALFGVAQPRVSDLVRGKLTLFSIDTLVDMLAAAGAVVELRVHGPGDAGNRRRPRRKPSTPRPAPTTRRPHDTRQPDR
jgi:predicted XRE-type DNA-binding protein